MSVNAKVVKFIVRFSREWLHAQVCLFVWLSNFDFKVWSKQRLAGLFEGAPKLSYRMMCARRKKEKWRKKKKKKEERFPRISNVGCLNQKWNSTKRIHTKYGSQSFPVLFQSQPAAQTAATAGKRESFVADISTTNRANMKQLMENQSKQRGQSKQP